MNVVYTRMVVFSHLIHLSFNTIIPIQCVVFSHLIGRVGVKGGERFIQYEHALPTC